MMKGEWFLSALSTLCPAQRGPLPFPRTGKFPLRSLAARKGGRGEKEGILERHVVSFRPFFEGEGESFRDFFFPERGLDSFAFTKKKKRAGTCWLRVRWRCEKKKDHRSGQQGGKGERRLTAEKENGDRLLTTKGKERGELSSWKEKPPNNLARPGTEETRRLKREGGLERRTAEIWISQGGRGGSEAAGPSWSKRPFSGSEEERRNLWARKPSLVAVGGAEWRKDLVSFPLKRKEHGAVKIRSFRSGGGEERRAGRRKPSALSLRGKEERKRDASIRFSKEGGRSTT